MISFKQFLIESRSAPLYHGTTISNGIDILESGGFKPITTQAAFKLLKHSDPVAYRGVSTTRSLKFAKSWGTANDSFMIFEFDQRKLTNNYQIKPVQYWFNRDGSTPARYSGQSAMNEFEEFIITNNNIPLTYVKSIQYNIKVGWFNAEMRVKQNKELDKFMIKYPHIKFINYGDK